MFPKYKVLPFTVLVIVLSACNTGKIDGDEKPADINTPPPTLQELGIDDSMEVPEGLSVGSSVPGIGARDLEGKPIDLYTLLKESPVVLIFYRGKWCPHCNKYMANIQDSVALLRHTGAKVIAITPETRANAKEMTANNALKFPIISDPGRNIMNAFKVTYKVNHEYSEKIKAGKGFSIAENNGTSEEYLPVPATYIINSEGKIVYRHFDLNYRKRPNVSELLQVLKNL